MHTHNCTEQVTILQGEAEVTVDGVTKRIGLPPGNIPALAIVDSSAQPRKQPR